MISRRISLVTAAAAALLAVLVLGATGPAAAAGPGAAASRASAGPVPSAAPLTAPAKPANGAAITAAVTTPWSCYGHVFDQICIRLTAAGGSWNGVETEYRRNTSPAITLTPWINTSSGWYSSPTGFAPAFGALARRWPLSFTTGFCAQGYFVDIYGFYVISPVVCAS